MKSAAAVGGRMAVDIMALFLLVGCSFSGIKEKIGNQSTAPQAEAASHLDISPIPKTAQNCTQYIPYPNDFGPNQTANILDPAHPLVQGSRAALERAGLSERYVQDHFSLLCAVDDDRGRRTVLWRFAAGPYETIVWDYATRAEDSSLRYSSREYLAGVHEIENLIEPTQARVAMEACIGPFQDAQIIFGKAQHYGQILPQPGIFLKATAAAGFQGRPPTRDVGVVDLETGDCTKLLETIPPS